MYKAMHGMFYSDQAVALRAFLRDKLGLPFKDVGGGWLIFDLPTAELGVHPTDFEGAPPSGTHHLSFVVDDIEQTVATLKERGVELDRGITDQGYGLVVELTAPGGVRIELYQSKYG